jgi:nucleoside-diphosphate-sugar epimerase
MGDLNSDSVIDQKYSGKSIVVLGASGFIGRWVARRLSQAKARLWLVVRDPTSAGKIFQQFVIEGQIIPLDLSDFAKVEEFFRIAQPAATFNLAGYGIDRNEKNPVLSQKINSELVGNLCSIIANHRSVDWPGQDLIHTGSILEYGPIGGNLLEDSIPRPDTLYGKTKLTGTLQLKQWCDRSGVKGIAARLFTVYGYGEHPGRLLPTLLEAKKTGEKISLTHGRQKRDFTYVEDVVEGLLRLGLTQNNDIPVVNLATGKLSQVREFVQSAAQILELREGQLGFGALPVQTEELIHDPICLDLLEGLLNWKPTTSLSEGLLKTLNFIEAINNER